MEPSCRSSTQKIESGSGENSAGKTFRFSVRCENVDLDEEEHTFKLFGANSRPRPVRVRLLLRRQQVKACVHVDTKAARRTSTSAQNHTRSLNGGLPDARYPIPPGAPRKIWAPCHTKTERVPSS